MTSLVLVGIGGWFMGMRSLVSNVVTEDYVTYAELAGVSRGRILGAYVMRNALVPQVTGLAMSLGSIFNGAIITEQVFGYPGIGTLLISAVHTGDYSLVIGIASVSIIAVSVAVLIIDLLYPLLDPRVKVSRDVRRSCATCCATSREFRLGAILTGFIVLFAALSFVSPYPPQDQFVVPPDVPPSWAYWFGTTSRGQDVFWQLTFAIRNTMLFGFAVAILSRLISIGIGMWSGYKGGFVDRVLMSINDTFIVIPLFPLLVLFYFVMRDKMSWPLLALAMACLGWAYDARLIRSVALSLKTREFTQQSVFSGMRTHEIVLQEHLPYVLPIVFYTTMNNMNWSIGLEVTLSVLGFTNIDTPTIGVMIYWANQHTALVAGIWWWIFFPVLFVVILFIGLFLLADLDERIHRPAQPARPHGRRARMSAARTQAERRAGARAHGVEPARLLPDEIFRRQPRGARGRRRQPAYRPQRDLRARGRVELRQDHADQDHRARDPPAAQRGRRVGHVQFRRTRARHLCAERGRARRHPLAASVLHPARLDERAEPGAAGAAVVRRFRLPPHRQADAGIPAAGGGSSGAACGSSPRSSTTIRTSSPAACASASRLRSRASAGPISSSPTSRPPRSTSWCRRTCSACCARCSAKSAPR